MHNLLLFEGLFVHSLGESSLNWAVETEPVQGADNRKVMIARGRGLGGSTLINFMTHTRPAKGEYDALESTFKNQGWNWDSLLECMKKVSCVVSGMYFESENFLVKGRTFYSTKRRCTNWVFCTFS